ncbi:hypothetical protein F4861DRAFT_525126 [Xylaria intraflava]|nr:hypothetical protein F4861DRAFT_525126 [Xylaria intraflava]
MPTEEVVRDGFSYAYGRFHTAAPHRGERVPGSALRDAFLPKLTPLGNKFIRNSYRDGFVRSQLKHYGVVFDEKEFTGNGTSLLKKVLQAGKCDQVPPHIVKLRDEMHVEWLARLTPEEISSSPEWAMEKYFLTSGQPDRAKTTTAIGFPLHTSSSYSSGQLREAADKISGLHHATGHGPRTQMIFIGWDSAAVKRAAKRHEDDEEKAQKAADEEREAERSESHNDYLKTLKRKKGRKTYSPVGTYIVDCEEIEGQWPDQADDLSLEIREMGSPGIYKASFDFGILEGVMIMSTDKQAVNQYCSQMDSESDDDNDSSEDENDSSEEERQSGSKRKHTATASKSRGRGRPPKKAKPSPSQSRKYYLKLRCAETVESMIYHDPENGTITFQGENMASFTGKVSLPSVGGTVPFTARKTSDATHGPGNSWSDYSEAAYEAARVNRWH